jgi:L-glutamine:2-deoxy-scyllo-inosose/3-amino-2,3-dideoxy-scyllo-inosose aminotransferase
MSGSTAAEPAVELSATWPVFGAAELEALGRVLESGDWGHVGDSGSYVGEFEPAFERAFADFHTAAHGVCVANGTVALQLALEALDVGAGDEVIVPGLTWQATAAAALDVNAIPILVDVDPTTYCIDPAAVEAALTPRTRAVIAVHLYDSMADLGRLTALCSEHDLALVEDCAHSHGSTWNGHGVGSIGDVGCFSFQSTKSLTCGEGGFCTTNSEALWLRLDALRNCGRRPVHATDEWSPIQSGNYRLTEWQASVLSAQFARFPEQLARRAENARRLDDALAAVDGLTTSRRRPEATRQGMYGYVVRYDSGAFGGLDVTQFRDALSRALGVPIGAPYDALNGSALYRPHTKRRHQVSGLWELVDPTRFDLPIAARAHREAIVIPHEVLLSDWDALSRIVDAVERIREGDTDRSPLSSPPTTSNPSEEAP